jgi:hypothetical protein
MDHNGLYTDLDSFSSITNNNSFNDTCPTLPSLNNFKYQQTNLSTNIYQQPVQTIHDQQQQQQHNHSAKSSSTLPQTQININNCNNNIFFPHDDGIFDTNTSATQCASTSVPNSGNNQKNNFVGYVHRKETGANGGGGDNITYNINNINTNIVNNINNPTNSVGTDIFGGNQYHQINKNGETIINFTNNNLNSGGNSMPTDTVSATSQNYYGYQANNNGQGQQTVYETSVQSQSQSSSTFLDPSGVPKSMGTTGTTGLYHGHHHNQVPLNQTMTNGSYLSGNANTIPPEHASAPSTVDPFSEYPETLSTAKIINNFESKNPLKYQSSNRATGSYYKSTSDYPLHQYPPVSHLPHHSYPGLYPNANGIPKMASHNYEPYPRISPRSNVPHYSAQHYPTPPNAHSMDEHTANRLSYNRTSAGPVHAPVPPYHHPHSLPPHPSNNYGNYYNNGYGTMPYSNYPQMSSPYANPLIRNESCSKSSTNYSKTGAVALSPVEHSSFSNYPAPKKEFFNESPFFPPHHFYDDQINSVLNSCAKKPSSRSKVNHDIYNPNPTSSMYDPHTIPHHPQNANVIRNVNYQPMPKHFTGGNSYPMPTNSCDLNNPYHNYNFHPYKNVEHQKMQKINPAMSSKQFKNYSHFEQLAHPPHISYAHQPQYHTMQAKHPEKMKLSIDLEEQINSSKIPKLRDVHHPAYGFDPHHPHHYFPYHHHMPSRNPVNDDPSKNPIANINISLRDFLSTWNEIDDDDETSDRRPPNGAMEDLTEHMERTIMREYNPMFVQKATDSFMSASVLPSHNAKSAQLSELESGIISEGTEKLYVLESIDVPLSELNKYKHLSVINKLPENVVINDKELYADVDGSMKFVEEIDLTREKLYKSEFELEFEACQERKINKPVEDIPKVIVPSAVVENVVIDEEEPKKIEPEVKSPEPKKSDSEDKEKASQKKKCLKEKAPKVKSSEKLPKTRQNILKLKKEKILKESKVRITKRVKKYSLNQRTSSVKSLQSICVDLLNTSGYRNFAREQLSIINKFSKMRILKDFKKKFNFEGTKKSTHPVNQKFNHSVRINSLREICGKLLSDQSRMLEINNDEENEETALSNNLSESEHYGNFPTLKQLCKNVLTEMDIDVVEDDYLYSPTTLKELCETFIYSNRQYFLIEEVSNIPKLQDLCKNVLSETNIFINIDEENEEMFALNDEPEETLESNSIVDNADGEPIYIVEENSGSVGELFESENLNSFERSEILRKIQRVASIEDDEIFQAIGALHRDDDDVESITNNNNSNVSNKNIRTNGNCSESNEFSATNEEMKFESEMSFMSYMDDDLMHSVQYEEIISVKGDEASNKIVEILRHKHLNRSDERQASKAIRKILQKALMYQRTHRFCNAKRRDQINALKLQARAALLKLKELKTCDNTFTETRSSTPETSSQQESENESQTYAKEDDPKAQLHQKIFYDEATPIIDDSSADDCFDSIDSGAERNFPKLPSVLPSINEYKIDRKSSNRSDVKDICEAKRRKLTFDESLLSIEKMYGENVEDNQERRNSDRRSSSSSSYNNSHRSSRRHEKKHHSSRHSSSHHSKRSRSRERDSKTQKSYQNSSRHNFYNNDQMNHSETKRLVIPSYKIYDKDLDIKLKTMPYVRIEREERVDDMVKKYN